MQTGKVKMHERPLTAKVRPTTAFKKDVGLVGMNEFSVPIAEEEEDPAKLTHSKTNQQIGTESVLAPAN